MCIRDRYRDLYRTPNAYGADRPHPLEFGLVLRTEARHLNPCLLYTSDAADERSSVDLGGRRIIKKKTNTHNNRRHSNLHT